MEKRGLGLFSYVAGGFVGIAILSIVQMMYCVRIGQPTTDALILAAAAVVVMSFFSLGHPDVIRLLGQKITDIRETTKMFGKQSAFAAENAAHALEEKKKAEAARIAAESAKKLALVLARIEATQTDFFVYFEEGGICFLTSALAEVTCVRAVSRGFSELKGTTLYIAKSDVGNASVIVEACKKRTSLQKSAHA